MTLSLRATYTQFEAVASRSINNSKLCRVVVTLASVLW